MAKKKLKTEEIEKKEWASPEVQEPQEDFSADEAAQVASGSSKWICARNIMHNGKAYKPGDEFPGEHVTESLIKSKAIGEALV